MPREPSRRTDPSQRPSAERRPAPQRAHDPAAVRALDRELDRCGWSDPERNTVTGCVRGLFPGTEPDDGTTGAARVRVTPGYVEIMADGATTTGEAGVNRLSLRGDGRIVALVMTRRPDGG